MQIGSFFPTASGFSGRITPLTIERGDDEHVLLWSPRPRRAKAE